MSKTLKDLLEGFKVEMKAVTDWATGVKQKHEAESTQKHAQAVLKDGTVNLTDYPYAGHLDHPFTPTWDINFGIPGRYYFAPSFPAPTTNTLFNIYHRNQYRQITDWNQKLLNCRVWLTHADIYNLDLRSSIHIDGLRWNINKIEDFNLADPRLCKVELIPAIDAPAWVDNQAGGGETTGETMNLPDGPGPGVDTEGNEGGWGWMVQGGTNSLPAEGRGIVQGNGNTVQQGATGITVLGNGNTVDADAQNVRLINTNNFHATSAHNGKTIIDGQVFENGSSELPADPADADFVQGQDGGYVTSSVSPGSVIQRVENELVGLEEVPTEGQVLMFLEGRWRPVYITEGEVFNEQSFNSESSSFAVNNNTNRAMLLSRPLNIVLPLVSSYQRKELIIVERSGLVSALSPTVLNTQGSDRIVSNGLLATLLNIATPFKITRLVPHNGRWIMS